MAEPTPGQVITPGGNSPEPPKNPPVPPAEVSVNLSQNTTIPPQSPDVSPAPQPQASVVPPPQVPSQAVVAPEPQPQPTQGPLPPSQTIPEPQIPQNESGFAPQFQLEGTTEVDQQPADTISWSASEYIAHQKSAGWYLALIGATAALAAIVYLITDGDFISIGIVVFAAVVLGIYAGRPPRVQQYAISPSGITIGTKTYGFDQLKSFSIIDEGPFSSITFLPMTRFMPAISIYYDPEDEEHIVDTLSNYLPLENQKRDTVDKLMHKIRF